MENGITTGISSTAFGPGVPCDRAQTITFLWRSMGSPAPANRLCPFTDINPGAYYYDAVLWALEKGIIEGTSATTFSPGNIVTRSQTATILWRAAGTPAAAASNPFTDVTGDSYYYNAVLWAVNEGITNGVSSSTFSSLDPCTRAQIVTFLYRYIAE